MSMVLDSITDENHGANLHHNFSYGAFGESVGDSNLGFTARTGSIRETRFDGLLNWNRWLNIGLGRWFGRDPGGVYGGFNLFSYAQNNVPNYLDPDGLVSIKYNYPPPRTGKISCDLNRKVSCFANCIKADLVITGGSEGGHRGQAHPNGHAVDFSFWRNRAMSENLGHAFRCASFCGFKWGQPEYFPDTPMQDHLHLQDTPYHKKNYLPELRWDQTLLLWYWTYVAW